MGFLLQFLFLFIFPFHLLEKNDKPSLPPHPFYVAVTEVTQNGAEKTLEVSCKFFADDFEETLQKAYKTPLDINAAGQKEKFDQYIPDYINRHLAFTADGKPLKLSYVGFEKEKESVFVYFEVLNAPLVKQLQVSNSLLHDFKNEQINIMHVTINGKRQSFKLDFPQNKASFVF